ncbi:sugar MFS transporter [Litoribacter alkaliphilus]|uniref:Sugar MFS transporter n=1 Tax=Litoribacter ruber TaxID=702568 RepID=A0AAP2G1X8_9BACT|nr:sugar MFS transporter [Litoribacter alkaliphilus]MBS9524902.1 sugar MFS transporter [Litoribacter alkaliphilus]
MSQTTLAKNKAGSYSAPLAVVTLLFFMWGFITCMNDILIPHLQEVFTLKNWQAMLIQTAFFGAYFFVSLGYYLFSVWKFDPIGRIGYKNGIVLGLLVAAAGCALFLPAASMVNYNFFLFALFVLACGITLIQIAANPYVAILGPPKGASSRLNMTQAFNSLGTTLAPVIGGYLIFQAVGEGNLGADSVKIPYLSLAGLLVLLAVLIKRFPLPEIKPDASLDTSSSLTQNRHLVLGVLAIFAYVGAEVAIGSNIINFARLPHIAGLDEAEASHFLALFWGGAMIGRFFGAIALAGKSLQQRHYTLIAGILTLSVLVVFSLYGAQTALYVGLFIMLNMLVLAIGRFIPQRTLWLFALVIVGLLSVTIFTEGYLALWTLVAVGLFNSIMFPTIFTLSIAGLGSATSQGSSVLVMAIVGGAIITPLQGVVADYLGSVQWSFIVPLLCYLYIMFFGMNGYKIRKTD